jgi:hypothetical protein
MMKRYVCGKCGRTLSEHIIKYCGYVYQKWFYCSGCILYFRRGEGE